MFSTARNVYKSNSVSFKNTTMVLPLKIEYPQAEALVQISPINCVGPDQTPQNAASDHGLHYLPLIQQYFNHIKDRMIYVSKYTYRKYMVRSVSDSVSVYLEYIEGWAQDWRKSDGCFSPNLISSPWRRYEDYNISFCKQWKFRCHCSYEFALFTKGSKLPLNKGFKNMFELPQSCAQPSTYGIYIQYVHCYWWYALLS